MKGITSLGILACSGALLLLACSDNGNGTETDGGNGGEIKFGLLAPLSGKLEQMGRATKMGSELAMKEINAAGGVLGKNIKIEVKNSEGAAAENAKAFVADDSILALMGPVTSGNSTKLMPEIAGKIVIISPGATSPALGNINDQGCFFRCSPSDYYQGIAAAKYAVTELNAKKASITHMSGAYGKGLADAFESAFKDKEGTVLAKVEYEEIEDYSTFDFAPIAEELFRDGPDIVFLVTYQGDGAKLVSAIKADAGYDAVKDTVKFMGADSNGNPEFAQGADPTVVGGKMWGTVPGPPTSAANYQKFLSAFKGEYTNDPTTWADTAYDACYLLAYAIVNTGKTDDRLAIKDALPNVAGPDGDVINVAEWEKGKEAAKDGAAVNYEGASGPIDYKDMKDTEGCDGVCGDPEPANYVIWAIDNGEVSTVEATYSWKD